MNDRKKYIYSEGLRWPNFSAEMYLWSFGLTFKIVYVHRDSPSI